MLKKLENQPLRVMFLLTSMPIGGAETLLVNLVRRVDRQRIEPLVGCLKQRDALGEILENEIPIFDQLLKHKYDIAVMGRLRQLFLSQEIDAVVTVGAGDNMFWGRLAARRAGVPVILSALHSTGWPDGVGRLNRILTGITDGFIAVAKQHAEYQVNEEKFPEKKVFLIPNGIDTERFVFDETSRDQWRHKTGISPKVPVVGIVAALRPEKNHELFLDTAKRVSTLLPDARFVIVGEGSEDKRIRQLAKETGIGERFHFLGSTQDVPGVLSMLDLFALTSHNEASPVSIMESLSCQCPVVATDVGSISESVLEGKTGFLVPAGDGMQMAERWMKVLSDPGLGKRLGRQGRQHVIENSSLDRMTEGYTTLVEDVFFQKREQPSSAENGIVTWNQRFPEGNPVQ